jgi:hypothetical protein
MKLNKATCEECGESFPQNRVDKQFFSGRCKSRNFRRAQKGKLALFEDRMNSLERLFLVNSRKPDLFAA